MKVSAIVLCYNSARYIEHCVRSLHEALASFSPSEVFVVENGSQDGSADILERLEAEMPGFLRVIYLPENTGTTVSRNAALRRAAGKHLLVLDSDATANAQAVQALIGVLEADPRCGIAVPRVVYPDGRLQISTDSFPTIPHKLRRFLSLRAMEERVNADELVRGDVDYAISAVWLMRRELLDTVGYLDERIFYSPEDVDYCLRVWQAGYRIVYEPSVSVVHDAQEISRGWRLNRFTLRHGLGLMYYFAKHRYCLGLDRVYRRIREVRA